MLPFPKFILSAGVIAALLLPHSAVATTFTYQLANHPDGGAASPFYGLRLDELFDVTSNHDRFTFDFEAAGSSMTLVYDDAGSLGFADDSIHIFGVVMGGLDTGSSYGDPDYFGAWEVDFVYTQNIVSGGNDIEVGGDSPGNQGSITPLFAVGGNAANAGVAILLEDEQGSHSYSFRFNNVDDHRLQGSGLAGPDTFVGWGWLNHHGEPHVYSTDWLFTGTVVPEPGTGALLGFGLIGLARAGRRRR